MLAIAGTLAAQQVDDKKPATTSALANASTDIAVSGDVVSSTSTELVITTDAGKRMVFVLDPATTPATTFTVGEHVAVKYHSTSGGTVYQAANVTVETARTEPRENDSTSADTSALPSTASALPLIGLLGLLALGGAVAVRIARS
jgi:hypothetical protein